MANNPIENSGVTPIPPTPKTPGQEHPMLGAGEEGQPKPFSLAPETPKEGPEAAAKSEKPSPMDVARDSAQNKGQWTPEEMQENLTKIQDKLGDAKTSLQDPNVAAKMTPDHQQALSRLTDKLNPDFKTIAKNANTEFAPPEKSEGQGLLQSVVNWIGSGQQTMTGALNYLSGMEKPDMASFMKLQFAAQRASQKVELFASIIGSTTSGIKTLMSTQLG